MSTYIGPPPATPEWTLLDTQTIAAGGTNATSASLPAYDAYKVEALIEQDGAGTGDLSLQFNGDVGANYSNVTAISTLTAGNTSAKIGKLIATTNGQFLVVECKGKTPAVASGTINYQSIVGTPGSGIMFNAGLWAGGNATQISTIKLLVVGAGTITGSVKFYGKMV